MDTLPIMPLTKLLSKDEMKTARGVHQTHDAGFSPIAVCCPGESQYWRHCYSNGNSASERYTPRAFYAISVWKRTSEIILAMPEFSNALEVEWFPISATFRSIRYRNLNRRKYIRTFLEIAEKIADSKTITVHYGKSAFTAQSDSPEIISRTYIMPEEMLDEYRCKGLGKEFENLPQDQTFSFSWEEIKELFVELSPIQLAFCAGDAINNYGSEMDQEFLDSCNACDLPRMKQLFAQGANIHAVSEFGEMAVPYLLRNFFDEFYTYETFQMPRKDQEDLLEQIYQKKLPALDWLISQNYNLDLSAYDSSTPLYDSIHAPDTRLMEYFLREGANPEVESFFNREEAEYATPLAHIWMDYDCADEKEQKLLDEMESLLKSFGAKN